MNSTVFIVDDNDSVRQSLARVLKAEGIHAEGFGSAEDFLARQACDVTGCILLDVNMPGISGIELQTRLLEEGLDLPVIFLTGHGDIPMSVKAMKLGAADFLTKPVDEEDLLRAIRQAMGHHRSLREEAVTVASIEARLDELTPRELEVMHELITGAPNKVIADRLRIAIKTVKIHRGHLMHKMQIRSVAELVHLCHIVGIHPHQNVSN